jgi:hypothetical protein
VQRLVIVLSAAAELLATLTQIAPQPVYDEVDRQ